MKKNILTISCAFGLLSCSLTSAAPLEKLIEASLLTHPSVRAQKAMNRAAGEAISAAQWQFYPTPSLSMENVSAASNDRNYGSGDSRVAIVGFSQPLWSGGRLTAGLHKAQAGQLVTDAEVEIARQELAMSVVQAYSDWHAGYFKSLALQSSLSTHQRLNIKIERRIALGVSPASDRALVKGRIEQTQADLINAQAQQDSGLSNLKQLVGKPVPLTELISAVSGPFILGSSQFLLEQAQRGSPSVVKLMAEARTKEAAIDELKADLQPNVHLRAERQFGNYAYLNAPVENRIFIGISTRFGAGLSSRSQVSGAQAQLEASRAVIESTRVSLSQQILSDYLQVESNDRRLLSLNASKLSAEMISLAWEQQFLVGTKSWLDIMNSARELAQVEIQIADANSTQLLRTWRLAIFSEGVDAVIDPSKPKVARGISNAPPLETPLELLFKWTLSLIPKNLKADLSQALPKEEAQ